jgi:multiple sugar transport system ATP-binding protein
MQVAEPLALYNHPENMFVAGFIGSPPMNFFKGTVVKDGETLKFAEANQKGTPVVVTLDSRLSAIAQAHVGKPLVFGIRPEDVQDTSGLVNPDPARTARVTVEVSEPMGAETYLYLTTGASPFIARVRPTDNFKTDQQIQVTFRMENAHLFDEATGNVLK